MDFSIEVAYYDFSNIRFFRITCKEDGKYTRLTSDSEIANFLGISKCSYRERLIKNLNRYLNGKTIVDKQRTFKGQYIENLVYEDSYFDLINKFKEEFAPEIVALTLSGKNLINGQIYDLVKEYQNVLRL